MVLLCFCYLLCKEVLWNALGYIIVFIAQAFLIRHAQHLTSPPKYSKNNIKATLKYRNKIEMHKLELVRGRSTFLPWLSLLTITILYQSHLVLGFANS